MALKLSTIEKAIQDPALFLSIMNPESVKRAQNKIKQALLPVQQVSAAQAESYTVEFDEFVTAVRAAGKAKINGAIVENPSDADLLQVPRPGARLRPCYAAARTPSSLLGYNSASEWLLAPPTALMQRTPNTQHCIADACGSRAPPAPPPPPKPPN
jgi:hypothetical protein